MDNWIKQERYARNLSSLAVGFLWLNAELMTLLNIK